MRTYVAFILFSIAIGFIGLTAGIAIGQRGADSWYRAHPVIHEVQIAKDPLFIGDPHAPFALDDYKLYVAKRGWWFSNIKIDSESGTVEGWCPDERSR